MAKPDDKLDEEPLEREILEPSDDEVVELAPLPPEAETSGSDDRRKADSTAVVPVTALQQYLTEVRRYP